MSVHKTCKGEPKNDLSVLRTKMLMPQRRLDGHLKVKTDDAPPTPSNKIEKNINKLHSEGAVVV